MFLLNKTKITNFRKVKQIILLRKLLLQKQKNKKIRYLNNYYKNLYLTNLSEYIEDTEYSTSANNEKHMEAVIEEPLVDFFNVYDIPDDTNIDMVTNERL